MYFYIFFLVLKGFQIFHFLHLAADGSWRRAANFTLVMLVRLIEIKILHILIAVLA